jgi:Listeria/Bacterioides repeat/Listeria/Bacterioides repeat
MKGKKTILAVLLLIALTAALLAACNGETEFTVTFDGNGGTLISGQEVQAVKKGEGVTAPVYEKEGYTLSWNISFDEISSDITATALWTPAKYTYIFNDWDGTEIKRDTIDYGNGIVPPMNPTKAPTAQYAYTFAGWSPEVPSTLTANITFTASYSQAVNTYTYTFYDEDGTTVLKNLTVDYGTAIVAPSNPSKAATVQYTYTFSGWEGFTSGMTVNGHVAFIAVYSQAVNQYTISFNSNGGSPVAPVTGDYGSDVSAPSAPAKAGYTFANWYADNGTFLSIYTFTKVPMNDVTVYAKWTPNTYTLTYVTDIGGTESETAAVVFGSGYTLEVPSADGYAFAGWYYGSVRLTDGDGNSLAQWNYADNAEVTAKWTPDMQTLFFDANDNDLAGSATGSMAAMNIPFSSYAALRSNAFAVSGYTWLGWARTEERADEGYVDFGDGANYIMLTEGAVLYAVWAPNIGDFIIAAKDVTYGELLNIRVLRNVSGGGVTYLFKERDEDDDAYGAEIPFNAGSYTVKALCAANGNYLPSSFTADFEIKKMAVTVIADNISKTYGDADPALAYAIIQGWVVGGGALDISLEREAGEDAGEYLITLASNNAYNYIITFICAGFTINPREITVAADAKTKVYGDADPELTYQVIEGSLVDGDTLSGSLERVEGENAGSYTISRGSLSNGSYDITFFGASLIISKRNISLVADLKTKTYGDVDPALTYQIIEGSLIGGDTLAGAPVRGSGEAVGYYVISQGGVGHANYVISFMNSNFMIEKRTVTVAADAKSKIYGNADPALTYRITAGSLVVGDTLAGNLEREAGENVGNYNITEGSLNDDNYAITFNGATLTITKRAITVAADAKSKVYGDADPALTYRITAGSLVVGDTLAGNPEREAGEGVGNYNITEGSLNDDNYAITFSGAALTITKRAITAAADAKSKIYGDADPALTYSITAGSLVDGDTFSGSLDKAVGENAGSYGITQGSLAVSDNYEITFESAALTVLPKPVTVAADAKTKVYADNDPALTYQITAGSLVGGDVLYGVLSRAAGADAGTYAIGRGTLANPNYDITFVSADLTITKKANALKISAGNAGYGEAVSVAVDFNEGGGALTYEYKIAGADDSSYAADEPVALGAYIVRATSAETDNYFGASAIDDFGIYAVLCRIIFDYVYADGGNSLTESTVSRDGFSTYREGTGGDLPEPSKTGYEFGGWFTPEGTEIRGDDTVAITGDTVLYALWTLINEGIEFTFAGNAYSLSGTSGCADPDIVMPATYNDGINGEYPVAGISAGAISGSAESLVISCNVTSIDGSAFSGAASLAHIAVNAGNIAFSTDSSALYNGDTSALLRYFEKSAASFAVPATVTRIAPYAFYGNAALTSFTVPETVTAIGAHAFRNMSELLNISIPASVSSFGDNLLTGCGKLGEATLPFVNTYSAAASYLSYYFGSSSSSSAAGVPASLSKLHIAEGTAGLQYNAFFNCVNLRNVSIPDSVIWMADLAFGNILSGLAYTVESGIKYIDNWAFGPESKAGFTVASLREGTVGIYGDAFNSCPNLTSVSVPGGVKFIGSTAFYNCPALTSAELPFSLVTVARFVFQSCGALAELTAPFAGGSDSSTFSFLGYYFGANHYTDRSKTPASLTTVHIADGTTALGNNVFNGYDQLTTITIPDSVTSIGPGAFEGCTGLTYTEVEAATSGVYYNYLGKWLMGASDNTLAEACDIPSWTIGIGENAFKNFTALASVAIPASVKSIGRYAFSNSGLTGVVIPGSVENIGEEAFSYCVALTEIVIPATVGAIGRGVVKGCSALTEMTVPIHAVKSTENHSFIGFYFGGYSNSSITIPAGLAVINVSAGVELIPEDAFLQFNKAVTIKLPSSVTKIGTYAFRSSGITGVELPANLTEIGLEAFAWSALASVIVPDSVTALGDGVFALCMNLQTAALGSGISAIPYMTFYRCTALVNLTIPDNIVTIGDLAFDSCVGIAKSTYDGKLLYIGNWLWDTVGTELTSAALKPGTKGIFSEAFMYCYSLASVTLNDDGALRTIMGNAFGSCSALAELNIPASVTYYSVSNGMSALTAVTVAADNPNYCSIDGVLFNKDATVLVQYPANKSGASYSIPVSVITLGDYCFRGNSNITSITVGNNITTIGKGAFSQFGAYPSTQITIGDSVTTIGADAFYNTYYVKTLTMGANVVSIGAHAFYNCGMTELTIPAGVTRLVTESIQYCGSLTTIRITAPSSAGIITADANFIRDCHALTHIYVADADSVAAYCSAPNWSGLSSIISIAP